ncbi:MAG: precorrin-4 C(11)-methyltransferase [Spirochaetia bacterium]|nr:precorrin-4 C(11)-methyltransferase [Spirochaetia bacterium]
MPTFGWKNNTVYFVGAGPGDPELITVKGARMLSEADLIVYADSLVSEELLSHTKTGAVVYKSSGLTLEAVLEILEKGVLENKKVVRLHTGDPSVFGAIYEQIVILKQKGIQTEVIPGVSSVFAAAAAVQAELTIPELAQTVILTRTEGRTPVPEKETLRSLAQHECTLAIYLSATLAEKVTSELIEAGWERNTPVVIVYKASWPDQKIIRTTVEMLANAMEQNKIKSQTMILAGKALGVYDNDVSTRSRLYDGNFAHKFRKAKNES